MSVQYFNEIGDVPSDHRLQCDVIPVCLSHTVQAVSKHLHGERTPLFSIIVEYFLRIV